MMRFTVFDRWGKQIGTLPEVIEAVHKDEINGEDSLTLVMPSCDLAKGQRIVWRDEWMEWHEHTVNDIKTVHGDGQLLNTVYCENSIAELLTDYIEDLRTQNTSAFIALQKVLSVTTWQVGIVDDLGTGSKNFYHVNPHEAIGSILETWGGEVSTTIAVSGTQVSARKVNITKRRGADNGKRFEWTKDIVSIEREVSPDDVCTALYGYGKGLEKTDDEGEWTGGYERKLTFGDINGGKDWVGDESARLKWGLPDGKGGVKHAFGKVEFSDCEDKAELLKLTRAAVVERSKPYVIYTSNVLSLAAGGFEHEGSRSGDTVAIIDKGIDERLQGRVLCAERYLFNKQATVMTLGNISRSISSVISGQTADLNWLKNHSSSWDGAASVSDSYINRVIGNLNNTMNATGGFTYYKPGEGTITYDKPEDQNPTMAVQIVGGGIRIANRKKSNGEWDWRTFGTGDGFTADELTAGVINGGANYWNLETGDLLFRTGGIYDRVGANYWNLDTGEFSLSAAAKIGGKTAAKIAQDAVDEQTQRSIFNKLTNNGQTQGIYLKSGLVYVNASYVKTGIVTDAYGRNSWNLNTGALATNSMTAANINATGKLVTGSTYTMELSGGTVTGRYNGTTVLTLDTNLRFTDGNYGGRITAPYYLVVRVPKLAVDQSTTGNGTVCTTEEGTHISKIDDLGDGRIQWWTASHKFVNGLCMYM